MPEINDRQPLLPVQPTHPSRRPARRQQPVRRPEEREEQDGESRRQRDDDGQGRVIDEYARPSCQPG